MVVDPELIQTVLLDEGAALLRPRQVRARRCPAPVARITLDPKAGLKLKVTMLDGA